MVVAAISVVDALGHVLVLALVLVQEVVLAVALAGVEVIIN